ncbi:hypothetical protein AtNW77_Chr1g0069831 [Arabidopsis thaliana]|uniref:Uncharacterized protein n=2 Tax=Arabidopsis TaxID=3701 RepID=A0A8T2HJA7_ARASU|nr:hypothetical protein ISN44_As01g058530 [Arabidopsis suecica]
MKPYNIKNGEGTLFGFSHVGLCTTIHPTRVLHDKSRVTRPLKSLKFVFLVLLSF